MNARRYDQRGGIILDKPEEAIPDDVLVLVIEPSNALLLHHELLCDEHRAIRIQGRRTQNRWRSSPVSLDRSDTEAFESPFLSPPPR